MYKASLPFNYFRLAFVLTFFVIVLPSRPVSAQSFPGGFIEKADNTAVRERVTPAQIPGFPERGKFIFPAPYNTEAFRLTNASDCGGADCVNYVGYSYWRNINNHVGSDTMYIFLGLYRNRGGDGPTLFSYNKVTDEVHNLGPLFDAGSAFSWSSAEGWYFSAVQPTTLYVFLPGTTQLMRYHVLNKSFGATAMDLAQCPKPAVCPQDGVFITQPHSSDDDLVHSATVQDGSWASFSTSPGSASSTSATWTRVGVG
jgi:hypothetical protein